MANLEANKQLCRDYFAAFLKGDTDWMKKHIAPTFVRHDPGLPFEVKGPEGVKQLHDVLMPAFPDMQLPLLDFVAEGEKVLVRLKVQATSNRPAGGSTSMCLTCSRSATACWSSTGRCSTTSACSSSLTRCRPEAGTRIPRRRPRCTCS
jgi:ketosteroid isomerase-like protein